MPGFNEGVAAKDKSTVKKSSKGSSYHHGDLKNELVRAGRQILVSRGIEHLSLREVARQAGVSHAAPYRHFTDKESLIAAIAEEGYDGLNNALRSELSPEKGAEAELTDLAAAYLRYACTEADHMKVMFGSFIADFTDHKSLAEAANQSMAFVLQSLSRLKKENKLEIRDLNSAALAAWSVVHGMAMLRVEQRIGLHKKSKKELENLGRQMVRYVIHGFRPQTEAI